MTKNKETQQVFPQVTRIENDKINQDISTIIQEINVAINRLCPDGSNINLKRNYYNILKMLLLGIDGLRYLHKNSKGYGILIMSRTEFTNEEKIFIRARFKSKNRDDSGRVSEVLTNEKKLYSESLPKIDWENDGLDVTKKPGFRKDIDG